MTQPVTVRRQPRARLLQVGRRDEPSTSGAPAGVRSRKAPGARRCRRRPPNAVRNDTGAIDVVKRVLGRRDGGAGRRPRQDVLDGDRADRRRRQCRRRHPADGLDVDEAQAERRARDEQILRADDAIGRDVGGPSAPGARVAAHGVVDGDRDVVGVAGWRARIFASRSKSVRAASGPARASSRAAGLRGDAGRRRCASAASCRRTRAGRAPRPAPPRSASVGPSHHRSSAAPATPASAAAARPADQQPAPAHLSWTAGRGPAAAVAGKGRATRQAGYRKGKL